MIPRGAALTLVLIMICCLLLPSPANAHPSSAVDLGYDPGFSSSRKQSTTL